MAAAAASIQVEPSSFDVVVCGTGLPESVLAAACAAAGKTVLHVDPNDFYGPLFSSSVPPLSLPSFLQHLSSDDSSSSAPSSSSDADVVPLQRLSGLYSDVETSGTVPSEGHFAVDLVGPRLLYCADDAVDLLHRSGGGHHVEFKSVELLYWDHGDLFPVPGSREDIFNAKLSEDPKVKIFDKYSLHAFVRLVKSHIAAKEEKEGESSISEEDLDLPFVEFLKKQKLSPKMIGVVLYAIAMADYDQEDAAANLLTTRDGMKTVALYVKSIERFANAKGAFIYPMHGHGELPQAFCRFAAVKGALYVLRMPVIGLLMDKEKQHYIGTRLASGQNILCQQLILDPSYKIPTLELPSDASDSNSQRKVARGICITKKPVKPNSSNVVVVFPPKSLHRQQDATLRVLQLSSNVAICPPGMFITYLSIPCVDAYTGKLYINKAIDVLFDSQTSNGSKGHVETTREGNNDGMQRLIWKCVYVQEITQGTPGTVLSCPMPDEYLDYRNILESTKKLFVDIYPNEEFLPRNSAPQYANDDSDSAD